jgi:hypothetical protein
MVAGIPFQSRAKSSKVMAVAAQDVTPNKTAITNAIAAPIRLISLLN